MVHSLVCSVGSGFRTGLSVRVSTAWLVVAGQHKVPPSTSAAFGERVSGGGCFRRPDGLAFSPMALGKQGAGLESAWVVGQVDAGSD